MRRASRVEVAAGLIVVAGCSAPWTAGSSGWQLADRTVALGTLLGHPVLAAAAAALVLLPVVAAALLLSTAARRPLPAALLPALTVPAVLTLLWAADETGAPLVPTGPSLTLAAALAPVLWQLATRRLAPRRRTTSRGTP